MHDIDSDNIQVFLYSPIESKTRFTVTQRWPVKTGATLEIVDKFGNTLNVELLPNGGFRVIALDENGDDLPVAEVPFSGYTLGENGNEAG
jgi:hypothetical protein